MWAARYLGLIELSTIKITEFTGRIATALRFALRGSPAALARLIGLGLSLARRATLIYGDQRQAGPHGNSNSASDSGFMVML